MPRKPLDIIQTLRITDVEKLRGGLNRSTAISSYSTMMLHLLEELQESQKVPKPCQSRNINGWEQLQGDHDDQIKTAFQMSRDTFLSF